MTARALPAAAAMLLAACTAPSDPGPAIPPPVRPAEAVAALVPAAASAFDPGDRDRPASRSSSRLRVSKAWARGDWARWPRRFEVAALAVAQHESINAGLWRARNAHSSASGFAQWIDATWRVHAERAGVRRIPPRAYLASPRKQARVFAHAWRHSKSAWCGTGVRGTGCPAW